MPSDNGASTVRIVAAIVGVIVSAVAVIVSIKALIARSRKKAKAIASSKSAVAAKGKGKGKETSKADIKKWYKQALDKIVAARLEKESSIESGEPVFLSHYISQGQFRHWVLHAHDHKYELRQTEVGDSNTPGVYEATIGPSGFNLKAYKESVITRYSPEVGHYFYSMIGWTSLSKERIDEECHRISTTFGKYSLLSNNCHDFLQKLADKVVTKKAPDWEWFRQNTLGGYTYLERPALGYQVIGVATWTRHLKRMKHYLSAAEQQGIDDFIELLEEFVEANLNKTSATLTAHSAMNGQTDSSGGDYPDSSGDYGHHDGSGGYGHHDSSGGHGHHDSGHHGHHGHFHFGDHGFGGHGHHDGGGHGDGGGGGGHAC
ncbi:hypothetical protein CFAM422_003266 [Trichoderma lentiforme]|uniref:PPPDE domain-containing protein n=1 Tax=Trichoderma lentiforme TaxID=1567552 RepID=A0A9P4XKN3_9HYPO|nr:hypothetical protein CFAM422_003266 [Trichoderma lentiforme]